MNQYLSMYKQYAKFGGRTSLKAYWVYRLIDLMVFALLLAGTFATSSLRDDGTVGNLIGITVAILFNLYVFGGIVPRLAAGVRRVHDTGNSGWMMLVPIYRLVLLLSEGNRGNNQYGDAGR